MSDPIRMVSVPVDEYGRLIEVCNGLIGELSDPGTEALAAVYCAERILHTALRAAPVREEGGAVWVEYRRLLEGKIEQWTSADYLGDDRLEVDDALELAVAIKAALATREAPPTELSGNPGELEALAEAGEDFTPVTGLWKDQRLSRLERVKAHRMEFHSELKQAIEAVDEEASRQSLSALRAQPQAREEAQTVEGEDERIKIGAAIGTFHMLDMLTHSDSIIAGGAALALADCIIALRVHPHNDLIAVNRDQWVPCSPEWLDKHPDGCAKAPRVSARVWDGHSHYHPANWPTPPAPEAETKEQLAKRLIGEAVAEEKMREAVEAIGKAVVVRAFCASDPLSYRLEFSSEEDRLAAANAIDQALAALQQEGR